MSTIASPRDLGPRRVPSSQAIGTPTSSGRPSLDVPRSGTSSPNPGHGPTLPPFNGSNPNLAQQPQPRRNRAALREYYNLRNKSPQPPSIVEQPPAEGDGADEQSLLLHGAAGSEVPFGELDRPGLVVDDFVAKALAESSLEALLRLYARVLGETRALDAEKKALVYDNYSKLISATETIRKMRTSMDPLNPMASTLDPAIAGIYAKATAIRDAVRDSLPPPTECSKPAAPVDPESEARRERQRNTRDLALRVLDTPDQIRALVSEGRLEDARRAWKFPRKLLVTWKEKGMGGEDVEVCIRDGDAAVKGEPSPGNWRELQREKEEQEEQDDEESD